MALCQMSRVAKNPYFLVLNDFFSFLHLDVEGGCIEKENYTNLKWPNNTHGCLEEMIHVPDIYTTQCTMKGGKEKNRLEGWNVGLHRTKLTLQSNTQCIGKPPKIE